MGTNWGGKDSGIDFDPQAPAGMSASPRDAAGSTWAPEVTAPTQYLSEASTPGAAEMKLPAPLGNDYLTHLPPAGIAPTELKALDLSSCLGWDYLENPCFIQTLSKPQAFGFHAILQSFKHFIMNWFLEERWVYVWEFSNTLKY